MRLKQQMLLLRMALKSLKDSLKDLSIFGGSFSLPSLPPNYYAHPPINFSQSLQPQPSEIWAANCFWMEISILDKNSIIGKYPGVQSAAL